MQILILSIPSGEQVTSLRYDIDTEALIGLGRGCQILLPDQKGDIDERHARIYQEDEQWYLDNLSSRELRVNTTVMPPQQGKRHLLSDGDMIYCGDYCLMASDFSPWQEESVASPPARAATGETESGDYCPIPSVGSLPLEGAPATEHLDDPFLQHEIQQQVFTVSAAPQDEPKQQGEALFANFTVGISDTASYQPTPLIDVLARANEDEEDDWSISRNLRLSPVPPTKEREVTGGPVSEPVSPDPEHQSEPSQTEAWRPADLLNQQAIIDAIMEALELMLADFSPDNLEQLLSPVDHAQQPPGASGSSRTSSPDFWQHYQSFYRCLMHGKHYRELFLQRLSNVLNR